MAICDIFANTSRIYRKKLEMKKFTANYLHFIS